MAADSSRVHLAPLTLLVALLAARVVCAAQTDPMTMIEEVKTYRTATPYYLWAPTGVIFNGGFGDVSQSTWYATSDNGVLRRYDGFSSVESTSILVGHNGLVDGTYFPGGIALLRDVREIVVGDITNGVWNTRYYIEPIGLTGFPESLSWVNAANGNPGYFEVITQSQESQYEGLFRVEAPPPPTDGYYVQADAVKLQSLGGDCWTVLNLPLDKYTHNAVDAGNAFCRLALDGSAVVDYKHYYSKDWDFPGGVRDVVYTKDGAVMIGGIVAVYYDPMPIHPDIQSTIPEPTTLALLGAGYLIFGLRKKQAGITITKHHD